MLTRDAARRRRHLQGGLTLIELMVALAVMAALFFLAMPDFSAWVQNTRMRTVAEALQNGVRQAQAEAVRRNRTVVFFLTNAEPGAGAASVANGANWGMRALPLLPSDPVEFLRGGAFSDVSPGVTVAGPAAICFNTAGQQVTVAAQGCAPAVTNYDVSRAGAERRLRIVVALGGRVRMCDPDKVLSANTPDGC